MNEQLSERGKMQRVATWRFRSGSATGKRNSVLPVGWHIVGVLLAQLSITKVATPVRLVAIHSAIHNKDKKNEKKERVTFL